MWHGRCWSSCSCRLFSGCGFRVWWPDLTPPLTQWTVRVAILCLLFNVNFTLVAYWDLFVQEWGTKSYIAAIAGPFIGLGCGYLLVSGLRVKDLAVRHAAEITTAMRNIAPMLLMMIFPFAGRSLGHGVDHHPQHHRHHGHPAVRPGVEARCYADLPDDGGLTLVTARARIAVQLGVPHVCAPSVRRSSLSSVYAQVSAALWRHRALLRHLVLGSGWLSCRWLDDRLAPIGKAPERCKPGSIHLTSGAAVDLHLGAVRRLVKEWANLRAQHERNHGLPGKARRNRC